MPTSILEAFDAGPAYIVSNISSANLAAMARQTRSRSRKALASAATDPQQEAAFSLVAEGIVVEVTGKKNR